MESEVTMVLTSCGRYDLLRHTLSSFFKYNTYPLNEIILIEDGTLGNLPKDLLSDPRLSFMSTGHRIGQIRAIDKAYRQVETKYIFHCEDDWEFYAPGFIEKSIVILDFNPKILQVYIRALDDTNNHPVLPKLHCSNGIKYKIVDPVYDRGASDVWHGFSFNPGLRRLCNYKELGQYFDNDPCGNHIDGEIEEAISEAYYNRGFVAAILADNNGAGYCRHIGWGHHVSRQNIFIDKGENNSNNDQKTKIDDAFYKLMAQNAQKDQIIKDLSEELSIIKQSQTWMISNNIKNFFNLIFPNDSRRARLAHQVIGRFISVQKTLLNNYKYFKDRRIVKASKYFDEQWYLENNLDVINAKINPLRHFLIHGGDEGRDPSPSFSCFWYQQNYPDVKQSSINPLVHYLRFGISEGRNPKQPLSSKPLVSVVMPVYNGGNYLEFAIQSIIKQTLHDFELIIIDDGSSDSSLEIIQTFAAKDDRILIVKNPQNYGIATCLNKAIEVSRGKFIAIMHADDICRPMRLEKQFNFFKENPNTDICGTAYKELLGKESSDIYLLPETHSEIISKILFFCPLSHPTVMFRKEKFIENHLFYDKFFDSAEDYELWTRAFCKVQFANLSDDLLLYRLHDSQITNYNNSKQKLKTRLILANLLEKLGISFSNTELDLHESIYWQNFNNSPQFISNATRWLAKLKNANDISKIFPIDEFTKTIKEYEIMINNFGKNKNE